jgi:hypothetical protein
MFAVDDLRDVVRRLQKHGGELVGEIAPYEAAYLLCYVRGPSASSSLSPRRSAEPAGAPRVSMIVDDSNARSPAARPRGCQSNIAMPRVLPPGLQSTG